MLSHAMKLMISDEILPKESSTILTIQYIVNGYDFQLPLDSGKMGENSNCGKLLCEHEREADRRKREAVDQPRHARYKHARGARIKRWGPIE